MTLDVGATRVPHVYRVYVQAKHFIDSKAEDANAALQALGGARVILCTTGNAKAMDCVDGELLRQCCAWFVQ